MEERKIQKVGYSTLSVSLPKEWIERAGVQQGDTVYLDRRNDGALVILSEKLLSGKAEPKNLFINCDMLAEPNLLERLIVGSYIQSADTLKIFSSTRIQGDQIERIRNIIRKLIGLNILEESSNEIILRCAIDPTKFELYTLIHRLSVIASTMLDEAMDALIDLNVELANDVVKREDEANSVYWLITRLLIMARESPPFEERSELTKPIDSSLRLVSKNLERIADCSEHIALIARDLHTLRNEIDSNELEKLSSIDRMIKELFQKAVNSFFTRDVSMANDALNLRDEIDDEAQARRRIANIPYFRAITIMLSMIAENSASIAAITINAKISESNYLPFLNANQLKADWGL